MSGELSYTLGSTFELSLSIHQLYAEFNSLAVSMTVVPVIPAGIMTKALLRAIGLNVRNLTMKVMYFEVCIF